MCMRLCLSVCLCLSLLFLFFSPLLPLSLSLSLSLFRFTLCTQLHAADPLGDRGFILPMDFLIEFPSSKHKCKCTFIQSACNDILIITGYNIIPPWPLRAQSCDTLSLLTSFLVDFPFRFNIFSPTKAKYECTRQLNGVFLCMSLCPFVSLSLSLSLCVIEISVWNKIVTGRYYGWNIPASLAINVYMKFIVDLATWPLVICRGKKRVSVG